MITDALGNPLAFRVTAGQRHEITQAEPLLRHSTLSPEQRAEVAAVLGDKGFDSDAFVAEILSLEAKAVIPSRKGRKVARAYDEELYKERNTAGLRWSGFSVGSSTTVVWRRATRRRCATTNRFCMWLVL